jgi:hypothetical protein
MAICDAAGLMLSAMTPILHGKITFLSIVAYAMSGGTAGGAGTNDSGI